jgi:hypothetical protein
MSQPQNIPIYLKLYQLIKFLYERKRNFPKEHKYGIGEDIMKLAWQSLDFFVEAYICDNDEKFSKIKKLSEVFDKLKLRLRMSQEINLLSEKQFAHLQTNYLWETGNMIGGWLKNQEIAKNVSR